MSVLRQNNTIEDSATTMLGVTWLAQTFTVVNGHDVDQVDLKLSRVGSPGNFIVGIRAVDGNNKPIGSDLCSTTIDGSTVPESESWNTITFSSPATLSPNIMYAIVCRCPDGSAGNFINWSYQNADVYSTGAFNYSGDSGSSWSIYTRDFAFKEYGGSHDPYDLYNTGDDIKRSSYGSLIWEAQTFTPLVDYTLESVKLKLLRLGLPGNVTIHIQQVDGSNFPDNVDIVTGTIDGDSFTTADAGEWYDIVLSSSTPLLQGVRYAIVLKALSGSAANRVYWREDVTAATYAGGNRCTTSTGGNVWSYPTGGGAKPDFMFECWGSGPIVRDEYLGTDTPAGNYVINNVNDWGGQSFTADESCTISDIVLYLKKGAGDNVGTVTVALYGDDGSGHPDIPGGVLASGTISDAEVFEDWGWVGCALGASYDIVLGTKYVIVIHASGVSSSNVLYWAYDDDGAGGSDYAGGDAEWSTDGGSSWATTTTIDALFKCYGPSDVAPVITDQSTSSAVVLGAEVSLFVTATGTPAPTYQWYKNDVAISGETSATLTIYPPSTATYKCIATNSAGSDTSNPIVVTVVSNPYTWNPFNLPLDAGRI